MKIYTDSDILTDWQFSQSMHASGAARKGTMAVMMRERHVEASRAVEDGVWKAYWHPPQTHTMALSLLCRTQTASARPPASRAPAYMRVVRQIAI